VKEGRKSKTKFLIQHSTENRTLTLSLHLAPSTITSSPYKQFRETVPRITTSFSWYGALLQSKGFLKTIKPATNFLVDNPCRFCVARNKNFWMMMMMMMVEYSHSRKRVECDVDFMLQLVSAVPKVIAHPLLLFIRYYVKPNLIGRCDI